MELHHKGLHHDGIASYVTQRNVIVIDVMDTLVAHSVVIRILYPKFYIKNFPGKPNNYTLIPLKITL